jgi:putative hydrolase of the HAD superfamily
LFEGAIETLEYLVEKCVKLALMTNGETVKQREKIRRFDLEKYFTITLIEGEQGFGKPDERVFIKALEGLKLGPDECWAVGDNLEWDVAGPQKMGIFGIWNDFRKSGLPLDSEVRPDRIINSIRELMV